MQFTRVKKESRYPLDGEEGARKEDVPTLSDFAALSEELGVSETLVGKAFDWLDNMPNNMELREAEKGLTRGFGLGHNKTVAIVKAWLRDERFERNNNTVKEVRKESQLPLEEAKMLSRAKVEEMLVDAGVWPDYISKTKSGTWKFYKGFFYRHGQSAEGWAEKLSKVPGVKVVDQGEHYTDFRGGASVRASSHFWVEFTFEPKEEIKERITGTWRVVPEEYIKKLATRSKRWYADQGIDPELEDLVNDISSQLYDEQDREGDLEEIKKNVAAVLEGDAIEGDYQDIKPVKESRHVKKEFRAFGHTRKNIKEAKENLGVLIYEMYDAIDRFDKQLDSYTDSEIFPGGSAPVKKDEDVGEAFNEMLRILGSINIEFSDGSKINAEEHME
jgi:urease gamma subunit